MDWLEQSRNNCIKSTDNEYPKCLLELSDHPNVLYYIGDKSLLKTRLLTVVGSRRTPLQALKLGKQIASDLVRGFTLVTGTADGGDGAAIEGALEGNGKVICVLAGGFSAIPQGNLPLLKRVAEKGLLLALHDFETPVRNYSYAYRNKILAKMGEGTLVLGAPEKSGALITARYAWQFSKPLFALPYFPGSLAGVGCNAILKAGGKLTERATDVFAYFGIEQTAEKSAVVLTKEEEKMYAALKEMSEGHITELSQKAGVPTFKAKGILSALEVKGMAVNVGGNRYGVL